MMMMMMMMMMKDGDNLDAALGKCRLTPLVESFHVAIWYVLRYCATVVDTEDLLLWRRLLKLPMSTTPKRGTSVNFAEELELLLRIALQVPRWFRVRRLEEQYAEYMHVGPALQRLAAIPCCDENEDGASADEMVLSIFDGKDVAKLISAADVTAEEVLRTVKMNELRQLVRRRRQQQQQRQHPFHQENVGADGERGSNAVREAAGTSAAGGVSSGGVGRTSLVLPSQKEELVEHILSLRWAEAPLAAAWDAVIGPVCCVHQRFKASLWRISELFHLVMSTCDPCDVSWGMEPTRHMYAPSAAILQLSQKLISEADMRRGPGPLPPWWISRVASRISSPGSPALCLFFSPAVLAIYMDALHLHQRLIEVNEDRAWRDWDIALVINCHKTIERGINQLCQLSQPKTFSITPTEVASRKRMRSEEFEIHVRNRNAVFFVESLLQRGGLLYEHLLPFLPKYRWYMCVELLIPLLQYNKRWGLANKWLRRLLEEPVHVVKSPCGTITLPFCYRFQKRGKWWHRLAQNLVHVGEGKAALDILEAQQQIWRKQISPHHRVKMEEIGAIPAFIQHRARLLHALFPPREAMGRGCGNGLALYNAIAEYHQLRFCRRSDRIGIERTLAHLHRTLCRWTPLPRSHSSFTRHLVRVTEVTLPGLRDPEVSTLWRDPAQKMTPCHVEEYVLRRFCAGRRRDDGWVGLHCEGYWVACLARILLWDAYCFDPDSDELGVSELAAMTMAPEFVWLSPLQDSPLDLMFSTGFIHRRRRIIEERLRFFEECSQEVLIDYVKKHCRCGDGSPGHTSSLPESLDGSGGGGESEVSLLCSEDEEMVQPGQATAWGNGQRTEKRSSPSSSSSSSLPSKWHSVDVGDMPLMSLLWAVPQRPLCALLRCMYLSPPEEGYTTRFSGFPDLVLWRETPSVLSGESRFRLVEVKSPNDTLSDSQMAVLDMLHRCGFETSVARVSDIERAKKGKGRCGASRVASDHAREVVVLDDDDDDRVLD